MSENQCQSCGMMMSPEFYGTKADGTECEIYCIYCCEDGKFKDSTMEEIIEHNLEYLEEWNQDSGKQMNEEEARQGLRKFLPTLKRWKRS